MFGLILTLLGLNDDEKFYILVAVVVARAAYVLFFECLNTFEGLEHFLELLLNLMILGQLNGMNQLQ